MVLRFTPLPRGVREFGVVGRRPARDCGDPLAGRGGVWLEQVHGASVRRATAPGLLQACDGAMTTQSGLLLTLRVADCLPVLLAAPGDGLALVHAGWRGLDAGILEAAAACFRDPAALTAVIGPGIGPCCFEVGPEVAERFPEDLRLPRRSGPAHVDLFAAARRRLLASGVRPGGIGAPGPCTRCHQHLLHSHRGSGGDGGRNIAFAAAS